MNSVSKRVRRHGITACLGGLVALGAGFALWPSKPVLGLLVAGFGATILLSGGLLVSIAYAPERTR